MISSSVQRLSLVCVFVCVCACGVCACACMLLWGVDGCVAVGGIIYIHYNFEIKYTARRCTLYADEVEDKRVSVYYVDQSTTPTIPDCIQCST